MDRTLYSVAAYWGHRYDSLEECADNLCHLLDTISRACPYCHDWYVLNVFGPGHRPHNQTASLEPLSAMRARMVQVLEAGVAHDDDDEPEPRSGYYFTAVNQHDINSRSVILNFCGAFPKSTKAPNSRIGFATDGNCDADPQIISFTVFRELLRAFATIWRPDYVDACCSDLWPYRLDPSPQFDVAWMRYLSPRLAERIFPPEHVVIERDADRGMTLIAAEETFDVTNPAHLAGAMAIRNATAILNPPPKPPFR